MYKVRMELNIFPCFQYLVPSREILMPFFIIKQLAFLWKKPRQEAKKKPFPTFLLYNNVSE
jgi:hypothetical protein